jgi:hypothetical protein
MIRAFGFCNDTFDTHSPGRLCRGRERWIEGLPDTSPTRLARTVCSGAVFSDDSARDAHRGFRYSEVGAGALLRSLFPGSRIFGFCESGDPRALPAEMVVEEDHVRAIAGGIRAEPAVRWVAPVRNAEDVDTWIEGEKDGMAAPRADGFVILHSPVKPALVEALVAMSGFLQRDRTALKILLELLLEHLEDYQFGRIVPVGDLFDVLAGGEEPMDGTMRARWQAAKRLYQSELLPVIQTRHDTARPERCQRMRDEHRPEIGCSNCRESACRADNRLLKTLLLAALVPEVPVLRNLTVSRLVQLNHGTLREVIPGTAGQQATARLRQYAGDVGKLRVGEEGDPRLSIAIDGVDIKPILDGARNYDTQGARKAMLRELLFRALGFERHEGSPVDLEVTWRGFTRKGQVYYGNVREMDRAHFAVPHGYDFRVVIDFPFDDPARTPQEDERHVIALRDKGLEATTVVWLPSFFSDRLQRELGELVVLDRVSAPENRAKHLQHLREEDRRAAELEMESLQSQKRNRVLSALDMAYGLRTRDAESIDESRRVDRNFHVLVPDARVTIPTETKLSSALASVVRNLLEARYPRHPDFDHDASISRRRLEEALKRVQEVSLADNQRVAFDRGEAKPFEIAQRMGFLHVNESSATVRIDRAQEIENRLRDRGIESPTVAQVRAAFDPENLAGMTPELADFCALAFAALQGRELFRDDRAVADAPTLGKVADELTLVRPRLPDTRPLEAAPPDGPRARIAPRLGVPAPPARGRWAPRRGSTLNLGTFRCTLIAGSRKPGNARNVMPATLLPLPWGNT